MSKSAFITRDLSPKSPFRNQLEANNFIVTGSSLLEFNQIDFSSFPTTDWIFFYSRKAVKYFINQIENLPTDIKIAAYGTGTTEALTSHNITTDFIGTGVGESTLINFLKIAKHQTVLFPQARHSRRTIEKLAGDQLISFPLIVYDNEVKNDITASLANFLVFTSPLNVQAYFDQFTFAKNQKIIVIGKTTGDALNRYGIEDFLVAQTPSEEGLAAIVLGRKDDSCKDDS